MKSPPDVGIMIALVILAAFLFWNAHDLRKSDRRLASWSETLGLIEHSAIARDHVRTSARSATSRLQEVWASDIRYAYVVDGQQYSGKRVVNMGTRRPVTSATPPDDLKRLVEAFPKGARMPVYYDPDDPSRSYLVLRTGAWAWFALAGTIPLLLAAGLALVRLRTIS